MTQVDHDRAAVAAQHIHLGRHRTHRRAGSFHANDFRTHVGQQHGRVGSRADAGELDDPDPMEGTVTRHA
jgi:hypothetical protein